MNKLNEAELNWFCTGKLHENNRWIFRFDKHNEQIEASGSVDSKQENYEVGLISNHVWEVVLSPLPARLLMDDTQAYIRMVCEGGNPVSARWLGGNGPWNKINCSPHLEVPFKPCVSGDLQKKIYKMHSNQFSVKYYLWSCNNAYKKVVNVWHNSNDL